MRPRQSRFLLLVLLALTVTAPATVACFPTVRLAAPYDAQVEQGASQLQRSMDGHLTRLEHLPANDAAREYPDNKEFYINYGVELRALRIRATGLQRNSITVEQLGLVERSLEQLRSTHESQRRLSPASARLFRDEFNQSWTAILAFELAKKR